MMVAWQSDTPEQRAAAMEFLADLERLGEHLQRQLDQQLVVAAEVQEKLNWLRVNILETTRRLAVEQQEENSI